MSFSQRYDGIVLTHNNEMRAHEFIEDKNIDTIIPTTSYTLSANNISEIEFNTDSEDYIYKLDIYSKYQDMSSTVEAATPTDVEDYKYRTAAITIRSM